MPPNLLAHYFYLWETTVVRQAIETAWISASSEDIRRVSGTSSVTTISSEERAPKGALYAIIVFLIGFILGTIRVLLVAPRLGETITIILEAPPMLAASWFVCRWCVHRFDVKRTVAARSRVGLIAFFVLMLAEVGSGAASVDRSWISLLGTDRRLEGSVSPLR